MTQPTGSKFAPEQAAAREHNAAALQAQPKYMTALNIFGTLLELPKCNKDAS
jgi:hypothetical protein